MVGRHVNNYAILRLLGEGGMGAVYEAEHPTLRRKVAVKILRRELAVDTALVQRFFNEARAANSIRHPNIIEVLDVGTLSDGLPYLVMEMLEGETLRRRLSRMGTLPLVQAMDFGLQAASALGAAHANGIIHRDLKPDNLFLIADQRFPGRELVKVLDFGIAKLRADLSATPVNTIAGVVFGTPPYMSPEQCRGLQGDVDHRADIYALGIILYELLCGQPPFISSGYGDVMMMHMTAPPPPPSHRRPDMPPQLERVILKALAKSPEGRFASMAELITALAPIALPGTYESPEARRQRDLSLAAVPATVPIPAVLQLNAEAESRQTEVVPAPWPGPSPAYGAGRTPSPPPAGNNTPTREAGTLKADRGRSRFGPLVGVGAGVLMAVGAAAAMHLGGVRLGPALPGSSALVTAPPATERAPVSRPTLKPIQSAASAGAPAAAVEPVAPPASEPATAPAAPAPEVQPEPPISPAPPARARRRRTPPGRRAQAVAAADLAGPPRALATLDRPPTSAAPPSAAPGFLSLDSAPWANVSVGGRLLGSTPLIKVPLPPGRHVLTLSNPELKTSTSYVVEIKSGAPLSRFVGWEKP